MLIIDLKQDLIVLTRLKLRRYGATLVDLMDNMVGNSVFKDHRNRLKLLITDFTLTLIFLYLSIGVLFWSIPFGYNNGIWINIPINAFTVIACMYICSRESSQLRRQVNYCRILLEAELNLCQAKTTKKETRI